MNNGADLNAVKELLGHSSLAATQVYTHNTIEKLKDVYKKHIQRLKYWHYPLVVGRAFHFKCCFAAAFHCNP
jgi:hypothetical protein